MRHLIAKIMVICLMVISVHSASGGEYIPVEDTENTAQIQAIVAVTPVMNSTQPADTQIESECGYCHAVHVLLVLGTERYALNLYASRQYQNKNYDMLPSPLDDIAHPPIILI